MRCLHTCNAYTLAQSTLVLLLLHVNQPYTLRTCIHPYPTHQFLQTYTNLQRTKIPITQKHPHPTYLPYPKNLRNSTYLLYPYIPTPTTYLQHTYTTPTTTTPYYTCSMSRQSGGAIAFCHFDGILCVAIKFRIQSLLKKGGMLNSQENLQFWQIAKP